MYTKIANINLQKKRFYYSKSSLKKENLISNKFLFLYSYFFNYPTPTSLNVSWNFGFLSFCFLALQIITGIFLSMHYIPDSAKAAQSVVDIMRNVENGWMYRYFHSNGASFFFILVYCHMSRSLYYNSYLFSKAFVWLTGVAIYFLMILTAFTGYVLPWGQMSYWAATVITNLTTSFPGGDILAKWIWGDLFLSTALLNRFFSIHYVLPFLILALVVVHVILLHERGSSNKLQIYLKGDKIKFGAYFVLKDFISLLIVLIFFFAMVGFAPNYLSHTDNYIMAQPLVTPPHIVPEWYFLIFYAMLRSVPDKLLGVLIMLFAIIILAIFPFFIRIKNIAKITIILDNLALEYRLQILQDYKNRNVLKDILFFCWKKRFVILFWAFINICFLLGFIGSQPIEEPYVICGQFLTILYFSYFILIIKLFNYKNLEDSKYNLAYTREPFKTENEWRYGTYLKTIIKQAHVSGYKTKEIEERMRLGEEKSQLLESKREKKEWN